MTGVLDGDGAKTPISVEVEQSIFVEGNSPEVMRRILGEPFDRQWPGRRQRRPAPIFALRVLGPTQVEPVNYCQQM